MASERILIVDDDLDMLEVLGLYLTKNGFSVHLAEDGYQAIECVDKINPDLILLDVMMPYLDGYEFCQMIRKKSEIPILFLSSKEEDVDKILGLGVGGDDFIPKSTSMPVIVAKVKAHLRRHRVLSTKVEGETTYATAKQIIYPGILIKPESIEVIAHGKQVKLSAKEFQLLYLMASNPNRVYSVEQLFELIWGVNSLGDHRTVMVHISNIRKKIEHNPEDPQYIQTIRGIGYRFASEQRN
ncbi:MAG: response regulator transcription factor [Bacillota bacterium]|uniref:Response regulator transcription factor n=2 Tax=Virgibacillus salarius TaxID=447199 RepID=A0A941IEB7_9BACI|nr:MULTISPECIES: response regulator transcription factor [Bacillaceae]NAZ10649.1 response regulator [Agaribacter marinus]MBR7797940.1 response regulator transcription factor [Virgibacillus salarius]MCC2250013.1 response regulator transcription factor [Virgibacillus sp. AGTR]QRZ18133.1 response regulator transcription factor [Virgibacillus sp. AGTR]WBX78544.1 response regulator transcription factor [Virgibacillus salarius]